MFDLPPAVPPAADLVGRLGALLREVTSERPAEAVHAGIADLLHEPGHDPRLAGVADAERFAEMWAALRSGSELPAEAWQSVVLPTVLAFSSPAHVKAHLELATSMWMTASAAMGEEPEAASDPQPPPEPVGSSEPAIVPGEPKTLSHSDGPFTPVRPRRFRVAFVAATAILILVAAALWWVQDRPSSGDGHLSAGPSIPAGGGTQPAVHSPEATGTHVTPAPTAGKPEPAPLSTLPVPTPTWTGPGPIIAPTAPQALSVTGITSNSVALSWRAPAEAGTGGIAYYRISRDGSDAGWTTNAAATITGLAPQTRYTFTVTAYNGAGVASPPSAAVAVTTQAPQPPQSTHPGQSPPTPRTPAPANNRMLATDPPLTPITLGDSFTIVGAGWPCTVPAKIRLNLAGRPIATPETDAEGAFRTRINVDASQPARPTVAVLGSSEPLTLTRGSWVLTAEPVTPSACSAGASKSIQIVFR